MLYLEKKKKHLWILLPIYGLQFLRYRAKHTEIGNFISFFAILPPPLILKILKINILKNVKIYWRHHHFTNMHHT